MTVCLNDELVIQYPEGFREMTQEEIDKLNTMGEKPQCCISDPERHIIICLGCKSLSAFAALLLGAKDVTKNMQKQISRPMQPYGYRLDHFLSKNLAGRQAEGFLYHYTAQEIGMLGESLCVKNRRNLYYIHFYAREELRDESLALLEEILDRVSWRG